MRRIESILLVAALLASGCESQSQKNKDQAMKRWQAARAHLTIDMARQQFEQGQVKRALATTENVLQNSPTYAPAHVLLGSIYLEQDRLAAAKEAFTRATALDPGSGEAHYGLGVLAERRQQLEVALEHYQTAWQSQPDKPMYLLAVVDTQVAMGDVAGALARLEGALGQVEENPSLYLTAGRLCMQLGQRERAVAFYREARLLAPESAMVRETLGLALLETGQAAEALGYFQELATEAERQNLDSRWVYELGKGDCYFALGQYHEAQRAYELVCNDNPSDARAWARQAQAALAGEKLDVARLCAQRSVALDGANPDAGLVLGCLALKEKEYAAAERTFRTLTEQSPQNAMVRCLLGQSLEGQGRINEAQQCYQQALRLDPQDELVQDLVEESQATQISEQSAVEMQ